jgi:hypothetical protein
LVLSQVFEFVQLPELFYAGSHGMDRMGPADGCNGFKAAGTQAKDTKVCQDWFPPCPMLSLSLRQLLQSLKAKKLCSPLSVILHCENGDFSILMKDISCLSELHVAGVCVYPTRRRPLIRLFTYILHYGPLMGRNAYDAGVPNLGGQYKGH